MIGDSVAGMAACTHTGDWTSRREEWQRVHTQEIGLAGGKRRGYGVPFLSKLDFHSI